MGPAALSTKALRQLRSESFWLDVYHLINCVVLSGTKGPFPTTRGIGVMFGGQAIGLLVRVVVDVVEIKEGCQHAAVNMLLSLELAALW